jgi:uncharacterized membrane protein HdeD (DUF308 family)
LLLRGIAAIVFGVLCIAWPGVSLLTLVILYGAFAFADGILALVSAIRGETKDAPVWWLVVMGLAGIATGVITFFWPGITTFVLVVFIGALAIVRGVTEIVAAIRLRKEIDNEWWLILAGLMSLIFGVLILALPGPGALALVWVIGLYAIAIGVVFVMFSFRLKSHKH